MGQTQQLQQVNEGAPENQEEAVIQEEQNNANEVEGGDEINIQ